VEKLNKSFEHGKQKLEEHHQHEHEQGEMASPLNGKQYIKEHYMESNSDNELDELNYRYRKANDKMLKMNRVIEDYKSEVDTINHQSYGRNHAIELNNTKNKQTSSDNVVNKLNQSTNPVIKNYLKVIIKNCI
jgi:hypothetical protein